MISDRHHTKQYEDHEKDNCHYCRRPSVWLQIGNEKVCSHCGTRVYSPILTLPVQVNNVARFTR